MSAMIRPRRYDSRSFGLTRNPVVKSTSFALHHTGIACGPWAATTLIKVPHYGAIANLVGQVFWLYSSSRAWRGADHISTICITLVLVYGVTNYWLFGDTFSVKEH